MNTAQVDLQQLRIKHILYKSKVRSALYGGTYDDAFFSRLGPVDSWLNTIGLVKYRNEPEMQELVRLQTDLNTSVSYLTSLYKNGRIDEAYGGLSTIEDKSDQFLALIKKLEQRLGT